MCIFSGDVTHVSGTKIMVSTVAQSKIVTVRDNYGKTRKVRRPAPNVKPLQLTVYSNTVEINRTGTPTSMILPFPLLKGKNRVQIMDLSKCNKLFKHLDKLFKSKKNKELIMQNALDMFDEDGTIAVRNVGSYSVSLVPNLLAFDKVNYKHFNLSPEVKTLLKQYYSKSYGFIVCQLRQDAEYHPFGYTHELREDGKLFIPTRHFHGNAGGENLFVYNEAQTRMPYDDYDDAVDDLGQYLTQTMSDNDPYLQHSLKRSSLPHTADVDWDHSIYILNYSRVLHDDRYKRDYMEVKPASADRLYHLDKYFDVTQFPGSIIFPKINNVQKLTIFPGYKSNHDLLI